ncbi:MULTISPECIES: DUF1803 domain-containing protein [unclassified Lactococcus]|uniref:DUF1803 domain-containing protein n=1 Tax=unclassified Lactococcus TaxID=2643510 RepID=UPI0011C755B2|nr:MULTISPECIES: DUF1803 domain-containing protein [unclassified Lactococcus]MQW22103.1 DUF1803 domain-containing protein [Lactococcus sp. dk101]TXK45044.1 DUF1803 domain-containing protein [Lactococcus sp. dk310]TXK51176.1 DUF1803 domain-containing protein [Lactococcus sp. dk322]
MKITIYNENRLTRQPFFKSLIAYLAQTDDVNLRQLHHVFKAEDKLDRKLDAYIAAGLIERQNRRYRNSFKIFTDEDFELSNFEKTSTPQINTYDRPFFVESGSQIETLLNQSLIFQILENDINQIKLHFTTRFDFKENPTDDTVPATLANYFIKVAENLPLTAFEEGIYHIMGDTDPNYALKYMTSFLLKFSKKDRVKSKPDIFVKVLEKYGLIEAINEKEYACLIDFEGESPALVQFEQADDFIVAQLKQSKRLASWIEIG